MFIRPILIKCMRYKILFSVLIEINTLGLLLLGLLTSANQFIRPPRTLVPGGLTL